MKIGIVGVSPDAASGRTAAAGDGSLAEQHWRRALEQAQWELRGHDRPAVERAGTAHREGPSSGEKTLIARSSADATFRAAEGGRSAQVPATEANPSSTHADLARTPAGDALGSKSFNLDSMPLGASLRAASALEVDGLRAAVERCVQWCTRCAETKWMPVSAHVRIDGNMLGVTLRDVRISAREAQEIHHRLRERLVAMGLELQELIINGHLVTPASAG